MARPAGSRAADALLLGPLTALGLAAGIAPITNNDIWLHLATGRWMLAEGRWPAGDVFSFVAAGRPYVAHEWGSELVFIAVYRLGGLGGLIALKALLAVALAWMMYDAGRRRGAAPTAAGLLAGLGIFVVAAHVWVRPHLFTWIAVLAAVALLRHGRKRPAHLAALVPLQILWTAMHGGFILGPVLVAGWAAGEAARRWRGLPDARPGAVLAAAGATGAACLINPYGLDLLRLPFELTSTEVFMQAVYEWQSPLTSSYAGTSMFAGFLVMVVLVGVGLLRDPQRFDPCDALLLLLFLALALGMNRHVPLFALAAAPVAAAALSKPAAARGRSRRASSAAVLGAAALLAGSAALVAVAGYPYSLTHFRPRGLGVGPAVPVAACDYLESRGLTGNAFTTYGAGAYVVWRLWPDVRVGMDSRNSVYGESLYRQYREALRSDAGLAAYMARWPLDLAVVEHRGPFRRGPDEATDRDHDLPHRGFLASGRLELVDFDDTVAVYAAASHPATAGDSFRIIHPVLLPAVYPPAQLPRALAEAQRAVARHPRAVAARWILANVHAQAGRPQAALEQLQVVAELGHDVAQRWGVDRTLEVARLGLTGLLEWQAGRCPAARRALQEALRLDPDYAPARDLLPRLGC